MSWCWIITAGICRRQQQRKAVSDLGFATDCGGIDRPGRFATVVEGYLGTPPGGNLSECFGKRG